MAIVAVLMGILGTILNVAIPVLIIVGIVKAIKSHTNGNTYSSSSQQSYRQLSPEEFREKCRQQVIQMQAHKKAQDQTVVEHKVYKKEIHHDHVYAPQEHDAIFNFGKSKSSSTQDIFGNEKKSKHDPFNL